MARRIDITEIEFNVWKEVDKLFEALFVVLLELGIFINRFQYRFIG